MSEQPAPLSPTVMCSAYCYALSKLAQELGTNEDALMGIALQASFRSKWGCFRTITNLAQALTLLGERMGISVQCGTLITKARSIAAAQFLALPKECDVWISVDDDVDADVNTLRALVLATREHDVVICPQLSSDGRAVNVAFVDGETPRAEQIEQFSVGPVVKKTAEGTAVSKDLGRLTTRLAPLDFGGASLMGVSRRALEAMREAHPELVVTKGVPAFGVFLEGISDGAWIGEDVAFCKRARACGLVPKVAIDFRTTHAGWEIPATWFDDLRRSGSRSEHGC